MLHVAEYSVLIKDYFLCRAMSEKFAFSKNYSKFMSMGVKVALGFFLKLFGRLNNEEGPNNLILSFIHGRNTIWNRWSSDQS